MNATLADVTEVTGRYANVTGPAADRPRGPFTPETDRVAYLVAALRRSAPDVPSAGER